MGTTQSETTCLFTTVTCDKAGINGVDLHPNRKPTEARCKSLIRNWDELTDWEQQEFKRAHGPQIESIFKEEDDNKHLWYPFHFTNYWELSESTMRENYWKSITKCPGKERHNGMTLNTFGILPI